MIHYTTVDEIQCLFIKYFWQTSTQVLSKCLIFLTMIQNKRKPMKPSQPFSMSLAAIVNIQEFRISQ